MQPPDDSLLEALVAAIPEAVLVVDDEPRYVLANRAAERIFGVEPGAMVGRRVADFASPGFADRWNRFLTDGHLSAEWHYDRGDGLSVDVEYNATANIAPGRHLSIIHDITDRKRREQALRASEERFARAFMGNGAGLVLVSWETGIYRDANPAFFAMTGYFRPEVIGRDSTSISLFADPQAARHVRELLETEGRAQNIIIRYRHKSGAIHDAVVSCSRIDVAGEALVLGTMQDLPDLSALPPR